VTKDLGSSQTQTDTVHSVHMLEKANIFWHCPEVNSDLEKLMGTQAMSVLHAHLAKGLYLTLLHKAHWQGQPRPQVAGGHAWQLGKYITTAQPEALLLGRQIC
jgi:hypothetical protein